VGKASAAIREWLGAPGHSLLELSERSGISYATCHRIVNERLGTQKIEIGHLQKMVAAIARGGSLPVAVSSKEGTRFKRVLFGLPKGFQEQEELISGWQTQGIKVEIVHAGTDITQKAHELHPDLILVDLSMPNWGKSGLEQLKQFAKDKQTTIVLTGKITEASSALVEGSLETSQIVRQSERPGESKSAGG
jgi:CheY-like chemotaxis protein